MKNSVVFLLCLFVFGSNAIAADKKSSSQAILSAIDANKKLNKLGFEWRDTQKKILAPAKKAWDKGEYATAEKLANKALSFVKMGEEQVKVSATANLVSN
ncbi:hypothetical protein MNBD_GAMMA12-3165 [hydrothermal vent metagenome]|uniref:SoxXA-binding protein n=1 Tax=hydrothermal vent metagenome TaxID=652676 RepID=A0A3B0ZB44_9ZZZZ